MEVEDCTRDGGPGGEVGGPRRVIVDGDGGFAGGEEFFGGGLGGGELLFMSFEKLAQNRGFLSGRSAGESAMVSPVDALLFVAGAVLDDFFGKEFGGFDVSRIVEERERLLRCVG